MDTTLAVSESQGITRQAENDSQVIALWLHGRSPHTQKAYGNDIAGFWVSER